MARNQLRFSPRRIQRSRKTLLKKPALKLVDSKAKSSPYADDRVRIFLDDDRPCPPGWTLARNLGQFIRAVTECPPEKLGAISLDWDLGYGQPNGHDAVEFLIEHLTAAPESFEFDGIFCHSGCREEAVKMAKALNAALEQHENLSWIAILLELPGRE